MEHFRFVLRSGSGAVIFLYGFSNIFFCVVCQWSLSIEFSDGNLRKYLKGTKNARLQFNN